MPVPVDLSKLSDVVKMMLLRNTVYDKLVEKVNNIDTSVKNFLKKAKLTELRNKISDVSSLATKTALTAVENEIASVSDLDKQTITQKLLKLKKKLIDHNRDKYIATPEFNTFAADAFNARLAQANLVT